MTFKTNTNIRLGLPKGRMKDQIIKLASEGGISFGMSERGYRPSVSLPGFEAKFLKPQSIVEMLDVGSRDMGFAGADWVAELDMDLVQVMDTDLDPVQMVAAAPSELLENGKLPNRKLIVASEYERLTKEWIKNKGLDATFVKSWGATEVLPPDDADLIVDITQTGSTLRANKLVIIDELMRSSTRLYANPSAYRDPLKKEKIDKFAMVLESVLQARRRVMIEVNVSQDDLEKVVEILPCMREPTLSPLHGGAGYAVKAAVSKNSLAQVLPEIKQRGGTDIVVTRLSQIIP